MSTGQYQARPEAMRSTVGNVGGIIMQTINVALELESMLVSPSSFGMFGSAVASANTAMQGQQVAALQSLLKLLQEVNDLVKRSADDYEAADQAVSAGYGGHSTGGSTPSSMWSSPTASQLATYALNDSVGVGGEPHSVGNVLDYMGRVGLGDLGTKPITDVQFHDVDGFANWLDASPDNQARVGVIGVYSGTVRDLGDVPGGVHGGDVVVVDSRNVADPSQHVIGIAGTGGQLYNHGPISPDFGGLANVRIYRPMSAPVWV
ncbi:WXG100 family type VII secretion target [Solihabitans fulvus]|uniref:WXG100 family type VII secretion target n=1 Tax=Solihabitans fulvus TaxID=1892852 RepID=A0A5B2XU36_9PSEU|nr:WXG100 family type VII secretion target [Solihabitans fulvus]KAA2266470.1 WXG100 family type VII secretion target [Solihabitans fulvus]